MTDIQPAVGREQLKRLQDIVARRRQLAQNYHCALRKIPGLTLPFEPEWARSNWQSYCVRLPYDCEQTEIMQVLLDSGIATRRGIMCAHREPAYEKQPWRAAGSLLCSEEAQDRCILLPLYPHIKPSELEAVASGLEQALQYQRVC